MYIEKKVCYLINNILNVYYLTIDKNFNFRNSYLEKDILKVYFI